MAHAIRTMSALRCCPAINAMNLRLTPEQTAGLRAAAEQDGISMQEAALAAVNAFIARRPQRLTDAITRVATEDAELLDRLSK